jgi:hypothetical protein
VLQSLALRCNGTVTRFSQARVVDVEISHRLVHPDQPHLLADARPCLALSRRGQRRPRPMVADNRQVCACLAAARLLTDKGVHKVQGGGVVVGEAYALSHLASLLHTQIVAVA